MAGLVSGSIGANFLKGTLKDASKYYEFWDNYRGKRIQIRTESLKDDDDILLVTYVIEGEIEDVLSFPPGFRLVDVEQYVERKKVKNIYSPEGPQPADTLEHPVEITDLRSVDDKFISFSSIDQIEWVDEPPEEVDESDID